MSVIRSLAQVIAGFVALAAAGAAADSLQTSPSPDPALDALRWETALLSRELELASGQDFYLRLDAGRGHLALMLGGVVLDDYTLESVELGVPRVAFWQRRPALARDLRVFSGGRLEPDRERDRLEVVAPPPAQVLERSGGAAGAGASPTPPAIPKTAEDSYSVPARYRVLFAEGASLEIHAASDGRNRTLLQRASDTFRLIGADWQAALADGAGERVRLRVRLSGTNAADLYRSLPPDVDLLVVGLLRR